MVLHMNLIMNPLMIPYYSSILWNLLWNSMRLAMLFKASSVIDETITLLETRLTYEEFTVGIFLVWIVFICSMAIYFIKL